MGSGAVLWMTGLSGAGKSTLASGAGRVLRSLGHRVIVLDGDSVRAGLSRDLGFSPEDRRENLRRIAEVASMCAQAGLLAVVACISPRQVDRDRARATIGEDFHEIYVRADLNVCEARDPKGLYARARAGLVPDFTGISAPFEPPTHPDLVVDTVVLNEVRSVQRIVDYVTSHLDIGTE